MIETIVFWCLTFALGWLLFTSIILIRNRFELTALPATVKKPKLKISVCIPARNEEKNLPVLLPTLLSQTDADFDVWVLNDGSTDGTKAVLNSFLDRYPEKLRVINGTDKPDDWLGKPWACMQLAQNVSGNSDVLLFLDADTRLHPGAVGAMSDSFQLYKADMITVWPHQILGTFWEGTIIPLIYYGLITTLPAIYVYRKPRWMPAALYNRFSSLFAAANGQCIAFKTEAYHSIGGHESVKQAIVEDVELARAIKRGGLTVRMFHGVGTVSCRMYNGLPDIFSGLRKNFLAGFGNSVPLFLIAAILHLAVFVLPFFTLVWALLQPSAIGFFLSVGCITLILLHRLILANWFRWNPVYAFTHPIGVLWFQWLGLVKIYDYITKRKVQWKGRDV